MKHHHHQTTQKAKKRIVKPAEVFMKKLHVLSTPTKVADLAVDDFYDYDSELWDTALAKTQKLEVKRWRTLKRAIKGNRYVTSQ